MLSSAHAHRRKPLDECRIAVTAGPPSLPPPPPALPPPPSPFCSSLLLLCRPLQADDAAALRLLHQQLFPLDYDDSFYQSAVNGLDGIVAWAASSPLPSLTCLSVDAANVGPQLVAPASSAAGRAELLAGFITGWYVTGRLHGGQSVMGQ